MISPLDSRVASLTPSRLRAIVTLGGGTVSQTWEHTHTPEEGGDGLTGHFVLCLADSLGVEIGNVGFLVKSMGDMDTAEVSASVTDFLDYRVPNEETRTCWTVRENPRGFVYLLSAFASLPA